MEQKYHRNLSADSLVQAFRAIDDEINSKFACGLGTDRASPRRKLTTSTLSASPFLRKYGLALFLALFIFLDKTGLVTVDSAVILRRFASPRICGVNDFVQRLGQPARLASLQSSTAPSSISAHSSRQEPERRRMTEPVVNSGVVPNASQHNTSVAATQTSSHSSNAGAHESHAHEAMFFLIVSIVLGTLIYHALTHRLLNGLQYTVVLFLAGVITSFIFHGAHVSKRSGPFGRSYEMWMDIDPHLLLFTLLPPLVTGDAMTIDTTVAKRVAKQCLYLAGPGVIIQGMATALMLKVYLPYSWSFKLSLTCGAILCATDPVAVVAMLKELGASPTLTVQIQGESLLNDGTAIVLYMIAYNMLCGEDYDAGDIISILVKMAVYAWGLGALIGYLFFVWIMMANKRFFEHSSIVQVTLTLCCAYSAFIIAEGAFHISGVLATVAAALVLAHKMWPEVSDKESMHHVWHMMEYIGNTVVFYLGGALSGKTMITVATPLDYVHLIVIYLGLTLIRAATIFASRPLLKYLHSDRAEVTVADACVMTWGGLRGAIGLALAIQVSAARANEKITRDDGDRVLFYVSGVAALTLVINASTSPWLVKKLGITQLPSTKKKMLSILNRQLKAITLERSQPGPVRDAIMTILEEVEHEIHVGTGAAGVVKDVGHQARRTVVELTTGKDMGRRTKGRKRLDDVAFQLVERSSVEDRGKSTATASSANTALLRGKSGTSVLTENLSSSLAALKYKFDKKTQFQDPEELLKQHAAVKALYDGELRKSGGARPYLKLLRDVPEMPFQESVPRMIDVIMKYRVDKNIQRSVNEAFLCLVRAEYWHMLENSDFCGTEAEMVLASVTLALSHRNYDVGDFQYIEPFITWKFEESGGRMSACVTEDGQAIKKKDKLEDLEEPVLRRFLQSSPFSGAIAFVILMNAIVTAVEQEVRADNDNHMFWLVCELSFNIIFFVEFVLKLLDQKHLYFFSAWNVFDFVLVILGIVGCIFSLMVHYNTDSDDSSKLPTSQARMVRVAQVFRMMRIVRLFRLYRFWVQLTSKLTTKQYSLKIAEHTQKAAILKCFSKAHMGAQQKLVRFFCSAGKVDSVEVARCLLQSQVSVYRALVMAEQQTKGLSVDFIEDLATLVKNKSLAERCERFVLDAHDNGILSAHESQNILEPMHHQMAKYLSEIRDFHLGRVNRKVSTADSTYEMDESGDNDRYDVLSSPRDDVALLPEKGQHSPPPQLLSPCNDDCSAIARGLIDPTPTTLGKKQLPDFPTESAEPAQEPAPELSEMENADYENQQHAADIAAGGNGSDNSRRILKKKPSLKSRIVGGQNKTKKSTLKGVSFDTLEDRK